MPVLDRLAEGIAKLRAKRAIQRAARLETAIRRVARELGNMTEEEAAEIRKFLPRLGRIDKPAVREVLAQVRRAHLGIPRELVLEMEVAGEHHRVVRAWAPRARGIRRLSNKTLLEQYNEYIEKIEAEAVRVMEEMWARGEPHLEQFGKETAAIPDPAIRRRLVQEAVLNSPEGALRRVQSAIHKERRRERWAWLLALMPPGYELRHDRDGKFFHGSAGEVRIASLGVSIEVHFRVAASALFDLPDAAAVASVLKWRKTSALRPAKRVAEQVEACLASHPELLASMVARQELQSFAYYALKAPHKKRPLGRFFELVQRLRGV